MRTQIVSKGQIAELFADLRTSGFIARQSFMCCSSCACAGIAANKKLRACSGVVYYHRQDAEVWNNPRHKSLMLRFGSASDDEAKTVEVGHKIVQRALALGIPTSWNGEAGTCITVKVWE